MWKEFKGPKIDALIMTILLGGHVPMVSVKANTKMNTMINPEQPTIIMSQLYRHTS
jgi:hypothetical protein